MRVILPRLALSSVFPRFRKIAIFVFLLLSALSLPASRAFGQTAWTVNTFTDTSFATLETGGGFGPGSGSGNAGDLRYVLFQAMATGGANTVTFPGCTVASPCTIVLGAPLPPIFETSNISSFSLTIDGGAQGAVIIDGNSLGTNTTTGALTTNRVFFVDNVAVTLKNLVIQNAKAQGGAGGGSNSSGGGGGAGFGAGLFVNQSTAAVVVQNTTFTNCSVVGGAGGNPNNVNGGGGGGGLAFAGGNGGGVGVGGGGGGVSGAGSSGGGGGAGGGGGGGNNSVSVVSGGSAYADNASGGGGGGNGGVGGGGGFGGGGAGFVFAPPGNGGFGGGGGGAEGAHGGNGGFGGGGGGAYGRTAGSSAASVGGVQGGTGAVGGGGGAAAGPAIFVVNGSVTLYNTTGSGFTATAGAAGGSGDGSTAGTSSAVPVFNYGGKVNGSKSVGPVYNAFTVTEPVGQTSATQVATLTFTANVANLSTINVLTQGAPSLDFNLAATQGQGSNDCAVGTAYTSGATCTVQYTFTPTHPGVRYGGITLTGGSAIVAGSLISAIGTGPQLVFNAPQTPSALGGGFNYPYSVAVDGNGNVYVADGNSGLVKVIPKTCTSSSCVTTLGGGFNVPLGVAVDGSGNVYVADEADEAGSVSVMAGTCTSSSCVTTLGGGFSLPFGVAVDGSGNVYVADADNSAVTVMANTCASSSCVTTLGGGFTYPEGVAVDGSGNVYVADPGHSAIEVMANTCASSSCVTKLGGGFTYPYGVAVDAGGNVYVADGNATSVKVMANTCASSSCVTKLGGGFNGPDGVAVDGSGNVYVADTNGAVKEIPRATPPGLSFATATPDGSTDSTDGPQAVTVANDGNAPLEFSPTPSISTGFNLGTESTSCTQLASLTLDAGGTCTLTATFAPVSPQSGSVSGDITLTDNTLNASSAQQSVALSGTAQAPPPTITGISPASGPAAGGTSITITGTNFTGVTAVTFSGCTNSAVTASYTFGSSTSISAFTPAATSATPCTAAVTVTASGQSNLGSFIYYDPVSTTNSSLTVSPSPAVAGSSPTITVTLVDANSNPIDGATAAFTSTSSTVTFGTPSVSGNVITATINDTAVENAPISVTLGGTASGTLTGAEQFVAPAFVVTTLTDPASGNGTPGNCIATGLTGDNSNCSLRDAVAAANALSGVTANIGFASSLTAGATAANPAILAIAQSTPITMNANMNINGPGANLLTIEGGIAPYNGTTQTSNYQVFQQNGGTILLSGVTVANGYTPSFGGGGLYQTVGTLTVSNSTFSGNSAPTGGGNGGAIASEGALTVENSSFVGNSVSAYGGAIFVQGSLAVSGSTFSGNSAGIEGGAIFMGLNGSSSENVSSSTFLNNSAAYYGGAIFATTENEQNVTLNVSNSTFSGNFTTDATGQGGAILTVHGVTLQASNSIFTNNSAPAAGGAIIADNGATVAYSVFYGNTASNANDCFGCSFTNEITTNPTLGPLANYGGPTQTMLPLPGSSAICAGVSESLNGTPIAADQRGVSIPTTYGNTQCYDIGAVQTSYALGFTNQPTDVLEGAAMSPAPAVTVKENGTILTAAAATVSLTDADSALVSAPQTAATSGGAAGFSSLTFNAPETSDTLTASLALSSTLSITTQSSSFAVTPPSYSLTISANPVADGTVSPTSGGTYTSGTAVNLQATPGSGYYFVNWTGSGDIASLTSAATGITMNSNESITANFAAIPNFVVTTLVDPTAGSESAANCSPQSSTTSGTDSACSLREAVDAVNALLAGNPASVSPVNIYFASSLTAGATAANPAILAIAQSTPITMNAGMNINGPGAKLLTIEGGIAPYNGTTQTSNYQVFAQTGGTILLSGVTVANGYYGGRQAGGGGLYQTAGTLTVSSSTFSGNSALTGGGNGGAIASEGALTVENSSFVGNSVSAYGGAIFVQGSLAVSGSTFSGNSAGSLGGAIFLALVPSVSSANVSSSTFSNNSANTGGAIYAQHIGQGSATLGVSNSTFSGNSATGVIGDGGAILASVGLTLQASNSIFTGNSATALGGAILAQNGATVAYSIFYGNTAPSANDCGSAGCSFTNKITTNPTLGPLANYGGPTQTMLPLPGSSAICAGISESLNGTPIAADQRGVSIPTTYGSTQCYDIGAVQTSYGIGFTTSPGNVTVGAAMSPAPVATLAEDSTNFVSATVSLTDADGALVSSPATASSSTVNGQAGFGSLTFQSVETGDTLTASVALTGTLNVTATSGTFNVSAEAISTTNSTVSVSPSPAVAGSSPTITVTLKDASGNAINGATAAFTSTSSTVNFGTPSVNGNVITATITDTAVENAPISVTLGGTASSTLTGSEQFVAPHYVVTTNQDDAGVAANCTAQTSPGTGTDASCSLRDAIAAAGALSAAAYPDISFDKTVFNSSNTVAKNTITEGSVGTLVMGPGISINGPIPASGGTGVTINGAGHGSVFLAFSPDGGGSPATTLSGLTIVNGTGNTEPVDSGTIGGGILGLHTALVVRDCTITGNTASEGAGIAVYNTAGPNLVIENSTITGNKASNEGGGIAIGNADGVTVTDSTITGNTAANQGGGIYTTDAFDTNIDGSTISGNSAATGGGVSTYNSGIALANDIVSGNSASSASPDLYIPFSVTLTDNGGNVIGSASISLAPLASNGGATQTMLPLPGSAAICAGTAANGTADNTTTDQRGATHSAQYCDAATQLDAGAVQTSYSALAFVQQPSNAKVNAAITPPVTVSVTENGLKAAGIPVPLTLKTNGGGTLAGTTTETTTASSSSPTLATYSNLSVSAAATTNSLSAALTIFPGYSLSAASNNFVVTAVTVNPTITFTTAASYAYGQTFQLAATSNSKGAFTYSLVSGPATVTTTGSVHITGVGPVVVQATEAQAAGYNAGSKQANFKAVQASQTITFTTKAPASAVNGTSFTVAATAGSGLPVTFTSSGVCTNSGAKYTMTSGTGTCSVIANQAGNTDYAAAPQVTEGVKASPATVPTPLFTASTGTFTTTNTITISDSLAGTTIYYTVNGNTPTTSSTKYTGPITISSNTTIKAIAYKSGYTQSAVATATYTITKTVPTPTFTPAAGTYTKAQTVTIKDLTIGVTIYYTTNGDTPTTSSTKYTGPITVSDSETIKALGTASGYAPSAIATATYTINP